MKAEGRCARGTSSTSKGSSSSKSFTPRLSWPPARRSPPLNNANRTRVHDRSTTPALANAAAPRSPPPHRAIRCTKGPGPIRPRHPRDPTKRSTRLSTAPGLGTATAPRFGRRRVEARQHPRDAGGVRAAATRDRGHPSVGVPRASRARIGRCIGRMRRRRRLTRTGAGLTNWRS